LPQYAAKSQDARNAVTFVAHRFRVGTVFDVTHLLPEDQERVPNIFTAIEGDHDALYQRFVTLAELDTIKVVETLATRGARGASGMGIILIRPDQPSGNKAAVIAHELAHEYIHKEEQRRSLSKQVKECHAEATAFVVMSHFGITIPYSAEYLINWGNTEETLRKELDVVTICCPSAGSRAMRRLRVSLVSGWCAPSTCSRPANARVYKTLASSLLPCASRSRARSCSDSAVS